MASHDEVPPRGEPGTFRTIYCLRFELESEAGTTELYVWLTPDGQSDVGGATAIPPVERIIDLRPGNWIRHGGNVRRIVSVEAYRALNSPGEAGRSRDGYTSRVTATVR